jgi:hypothetical protein
LANKSFHHAVAVFAFDMNQHDKPGLAFNQGGNMRVLAARKQIAFPMPRHGPILDLGRAIFDGDSIDDLASRLAGRARCLAAPHNPSAPQMAGQLLLQDTAGLDEQALVDRLVRYTHRSVSAIFSLEPP